MPTISAQVQTFTQDYLAPNVADTVTNGNVLACVLLNNAKPWYGEQYKKSVKYQGQSLGGSFFGNDTFNTNQVTTKVQLAYNARGYYWPVTITGIERDLNAVSPGSAVRLVAQAMDEAAGDMADGVADTLYSDGTGNSNKDFLGLAAIADDGGEVATIGGLSRSTYSTLQANEYDITGDITLANLATAVSAASKGGSRISLHTTTETEWNTYEALLQPTVRHDMNMGGYKQVTAYGTIPAEKAGLTGDLGFDSLTFRGRPIVADEKCPANKWYGLNMRELAFYMVKSTSKNYRPVKQLPTKTMEGVYDAKSIGQAKNTAFNWSGLEESRNQYSEIGFFVILGNLLSFNFNRHFQINFS